jgi:peptidyl-prolyl cis-trans isomerase C
MNRNILLFMACIPLLVACQTDQDTAVGEDEVVLVLVDGEPVTLPMLELVMRSEGVSEDEHERMRALLDELIRMRAVANVAERDGLADESEIRAERRLRDMEILNRHYINHMQRQHPIGDEDIEEVYRRQRDRAGDWQFQIETITYPDQATALRVLAGIDDGDEEYVGVREQAEARGLSIEQPGWVDLSQVPEDFAAVLEGREPGAVVTLPLETPQGWRLVKVLDRRELEVPPLEQVREGIARSLMQQRRQVLVEEIYEQADIEPMLPLEED